MVSFFMKNKLKSLTKSILMPLGLTAATSGTDPVIHQLIFESSVITLIISDEEMNDILKEVKSLEESGVLIKGVSETIQNEVKEQKGNW